ncbi:uncharacterized protein LOC127874675 isoform X3 [Dreissena polymorpha]|uniref:BTB domain-containing protein n=1 Tax=Dreissena polymorpha TaxID=45954 RepID=A0A9D4R237_DREPO|nr:uncharacterized protein LOC127874675 isoform X3 [Dreissena polymorpha]KAH3851162.1 hypothetical protein DPMN_093643 [Dreissena polymorpha]
MDYPKPFAAPNTTRAIAAMDHSMLDDLLDDLKPFAAPTTRRANAAIDVSMFGQSSGLADVTLIVENVRIPVIKATLMVTSPVFRAMLQAECKEKDQNEIQLPGKRLESFIPFLRCIYPDLKDRVTANDAAIILPLASEYQVVKLMEQCEDCLLFLIEQTTNMYMSCESLCKYLNLAENCDRQRLRETCAVWVSTFPLNDRKRYITQYKISAESELQISNCACTRHELFEADARALQKEQTDIFLHVKKNTSFQYENKSTVAEVFTGLRIAYYFNGRRSTEYRRRIENMRDICFKNPNDIPVYNEFKTLPHDLKFDLQEIIPGFRKI